jgi:hypothetical protein
MCRMASDDCYGDYLSPDSRDILLWWICSTIREENILLELIDVSEILAQIIQYISYHCFYAGFYQMFVMKIV